MKKWIAPICSAVVGILSFIMLCLDWVGMKLVSIPAIGQTEKDAITGWDLIKDSKLYNEIDGYTLFKVSAIIMLVVAVIAIIAAIVLLLNNLNVIKLNLDLNLINNIVLSVLLGVVILAFVGLFIMRADMLSSLKENPFVDVDKSSIFAHVGAWLQLVITGVACGLGWAFGRKAK